MALPIRETPVLTGMDAVRFIEEMNRPRTAEEIKKNREDYERGKAIYEEMKRKGHSIDL